MDVKLEPQARSDAGRASRLEVEREGSIVRLIIRADSEYDAMMLYDRATEEARNGYVKIEFSTTPIDGGRR